MKDLLVYVLCFIFSSLINIAWADNNLCIAINNFGTVPINVSGANSIEEHIVKPRETLILPEKEVSAACFPDWGCDVIILPIEQNTKGLSLKPLPKGSRIIYSQPDLYYVNRTANVPCIPDL
ncbi:TPA: hypothetical protein ACHW7I_002005 [Legionella pneumophila]|uniref:Uncharacterized protein n=1 Tax=Legionella pneumophila subsp. pneumophila TaxID=91891 RepID=A0AAV2UWN5_LEGPN|nr:hypothetical protein [Legionella pneumophila]MCK1849196.1 hypothetical protein [Legionella pneumophila]MCZ4806978.1 hypothetical protein [Legionella pneumophila]MDI9850976.1 hypothetical protein [Legionella pneumophila]MDW8854208.1 hypothetical protein [Legionella pneumophila]MDW8866780.1 hypothetical protein [Legionella pneumophila]